MEYAGHRNIYTPPYGAIILLCPLSAKRKNKNSFRIPQMNFKLHINMNLSPDFSCFEVTEISANWLNALSLLIKSKHLCICDVWDWWCGSGQNSCRDGVRVLLWLERDSAAALIDRCRRLALEFAQPDSDSEPWLIPCQRQGSHLWVGKENVMMLPRETEQKNNTPLRWVSRTL